MWSLSLRPDHEISVNFSKSLCRQIMGAWLEVPEIDSYMGRRLTNKSRYYRGRRIRKYHCDLYVNIHPGDIANMNDVTEVPLWECEIPLSDDGY